MRLFFKNIFLYSEKIIPSALFNLIIKGEGILLIK